jgi:hypothetical protein
MEQRVYVLQLSIAVPSVPGEDYPAPAAVAEVLNSALAYDIDPDYWGQWIVSVASPVSG